jgi:hypothetical protein
LQGGAHWTHPFTAEVTVGIKGQLLVVAGTDRVLASPVSVFGRTMCSPCSQGAQKN